MRTRGFENLRVYRLSEDLADTIWDVALTWHPFARDTVGKQIVRAADSVPANISEGTGRGTYKDNRRFARTARASLCETRNWLRRAYRRRLISGAQVAQLKLMVDNLGPQLNAYIKSIGRIRPPKSRERDAEIDVPDDLTAE